MLRIFLILSLFLTACSNSSMQTTKPYKGNIQESFTELARTKLEKTYDINMPLSGELKRIDLEPGDTVKKDQVIAELELDIWKHAMLEAKAKVNNTQHIYDQNLRELKRFEKLYKQNFVSQSDLDNLRFKVKALNALLKQMKESLLIAEYNLKLATIKSPIEGTILKRFTQGGTWMFEGTKLLQIGNLDELEGVADVLTHQAQQLNIGDPVILTSLDNKITLQGEVKRIDPAGFTKKSSLGVDEQRVYVTIKILDSKDSNLGTEFQLQAKFLVGTQDKDVLIVPRFSVLLDENEKHYVVKVKDKKLIKQIVEIGIQTDKEVSIKKGLTIEDSIIAEPTADIKIYNKK